MRRLSLWMRAHPIFGDTMIAVVLALLELTSLSARAGGSFATEHPLAYWSVWALLIVPVVFRRVNPLVTAYVILAGGILQLLTHGGVGDSGSSLPFRGADFALGVALYTMVAYAGRRKALPYGFWLLAGTWIWATWRIGLGRDAFFLGLACLTVFGFCWALGEFAGARKAYHAEVEERLKLLETERDQQARIAVARERTRIARELHDVVAHAVSVIVVQADGAAFALDSDPDLARTALGTIAGTGREALGELRRLLEVLRSEHDEGEQRAPQPNVAALPELVDRVTAIGLPVWLVFRGDLAALPAAVGLGIYRIVQESLTNTLKHAGQGASAHVRVERVGGLVEVEVGDEGPGSAGGLAVAARASVGVTGGNGLIGMRERATVLGGTLDAGPRPGGGWRVRATFPVQPKTSGDVSVAG